LNHIPNNLARKINVGISRHSDAEAAIMLGPSKFFNQPDEYLCYYYLSIWNCEMFGRYYHQILWGSQV